MFCNAALYQTLWQSSALITGAHAAAQTEQHAICFQCVPRPQSLYAVPAVRCGKNLHLQLLASSNTNCRTFFLNAVASRFQIRRSTRIRLLPPAANVSCSTCNIPSPCCSKARALACQPTSTFGAAFQAVDVKRIDSQSAVRNDMLLPSGFLNEGEVLKIWGDNAHCAVSIPPHAASMPPLSHSIANSSSEMNCVGTKLHGTVQAGVEGGARANR